MQKCHENVFADFMPAYSFIRGSWVKLRPAGGSRGPVSLLGQQPLNLVCGDGLLPCSVCKGMTTATSHPKWLGTGLSRLN